MTRLGVFGIGNVLMGDDALGPYVVATLAAAFQPAAGVELRDAGAPGSDLTVLLDGLDAAVVVDVVRERGRAGELRRVDREELTRGAPRGPLGRHGPGLGEALRELAALGRAPGEACLLGVVPERLEPGPGLSEAVRAAVPRAVAAVLLEAARLGAPFTPRVPPREPDLWWERRPRAESP